MDRKYGCWKRLLAGIMTVALFCFSLSIVAGAYSTWTPAKMIGGVGQSGNHTRYYWIDPDSSFSSTWQQRIINAAYDWNHTGSQGCGVYTSVWIQKTTNKHSSVIDISKVSLPFSFYGGTTHYTEAGNPNSSIDLDIPSQRQNWVWTDIIINVKLCNEGNSNGQGVLTAPQKRAVVEHEMGHAFGLRDYSGVYKIMHPFGNSCLATQPSADDCYGVNSLYGGYNP